VAGFPKALIQEGIPNIKSGSIGQIVAFSYPLS